MCPYCDTWLKSYDQLHRCKRTNQTVGTEVEETLYPANTPVYSQGEVTIIRPTEGFQEEALEATDLDGCAIFLPRLWAKLFIKHRTWTQLATEYNKKHFFR